LNEFLFYNKSALFRILHSLSVPFHINSLSFLFVVMWERNVKRIRMKNPVGAGFLSSFVRSGVLSSLCHAVPSSLRSSRMEGDVRRLTRVTYGEARDRNGQGNSRFAHPRSCVTSSPLHLFRLSEPEALRAGGEGVGEETTAGSFITSLVPSPLLTSSVGTE